MPGAFPISSVPGWFGAWSPKKKQHHWRDGKSAKELAKQWFPATGGPVIPPAFETLLRSHRVTSEIQITDAEGEREVPLDDFKGETRNCDLVLNGSSGGLRVIIHVEAKADEPFGTKGRSVAEARAAATSPRSKIPDRISNISVLLFGSREIDDAVGALNYQLFYSAAGALIDAEKAGASVAVFAVHELLPRNARHNFVDEEDGVTRAMDWEQIAKNRAAYELFIETLVRRYPGAVCHRGELWEIGGFQPYAGGRWNTQMIDVPITLVIGKATDWTA
jgi:hypothetical protein